MIVSKSAEWAIHVVALELVVGDEEKDGGPRR